MIEPTARVHPSVDLEDDVSVGPGPSVWNHAQLRRGSRIGAGCIEGHVILAMAKGEDVRAVLEGSFHGHDPSAGLTNEPRAFRITACH